ncbi:hypothetical protein Tcan_04112 [Toxocara canis]|uniref:Uncharacterized protein n=1 Tax=Toxocara canis TaxID=6265 RepID=A0A0B2VL57_TOXCA|nr:hypothetical protein Tcan_04112 [Toxocara canis]
MTGYTLAPLSFRGNFMSGFLWSHPSVEGRDDLLGYTGRLLISSLRGFASGGRKIPSSRPPPPPRRCHLSKHTPAAPKNAKPTTYRNSAETFGGMPRTEFSTNSREFLEPLSRSSEAQVGGTSNAVRNCQHGVLLAELKASSTTWSMRNMSTSLNWSERYGGCGARRGNPQRTGIWSSRVICCASCTLKATAALLACNVRLLLRLAFGSSALSYLVWK